MRFSNVPSTITKEQLRQRMDIAVKYSDRLEFAPEEYISNGLMVVYFVQQPSENFIRSKIRSWHDKPYSNNQSSKIKCQLERNMSFFDWENDEDFSTRSRASNTNNQIRSTKTKLAPWYNGNQDSSSDESNLRPVQTKRNKPMSKRQC